MAGIQTTFCWHRSAQTTCHPSNLAANSDEINSGPTLVLQSSLPPKVCLPPAELRLRSRSTITGVHQSPATCTSVQESPPSTPCKAPFASMITLVPAPFVGLALRTKTRKETKVETLSPVTSSKIKAFSETSVPIFSLFSSKAVPKCPPHFGSP